MVRENTIKIRGKGEKEKLKHLVGKHSKNFKICKFLWFLSKFRNFAKTIEKKLCLSKKEEVYFMPQEVCNI